MSHSEEHVPPDFKQLIEGLMHFFEERKWCPILLLNSDDDERFLKWKEGNSGRRVMAG